ncbi:MAG TPA: metallophosphoesterase [Methanoregulaceae archaeon]|jgi:Icc-related predicted phosphoesterase|nr:metallophosphoesterase [Methanoregulaceae archaeon]HOB58461.1 metallophosphoesterase [Methanoregulaceae archaeon]HOH80876.1 metallophosphoesterase [Methanoregulaceae archaeon]HPW10911.1 metallophosphoesterase [Methanoregulaceae archaeon]
MMDVLLLADLHGEYGKLDPFLDLNPDAVFIAGDLTNMGPAESVTDVLDRIDVPCFAVPGNCDPRETIDVLEQSDCVCLHGAQINLGKISICGIGGSNPTPFSTLFELTDKQIDDLLHKVLQKRELAMHNVLISHAPPYGLLDQANGNHVGSQSVRRHLTSFDLVCCAHIHEERGIAIEEGVKVVNPGMAALGDGAMIHFGNEPKEIEIELITV